MFRRRGSGGLLPLTSAGRWRVRIGTIYRMLSHSFSSLLGQRVLTTTCRPHFKYVDVDCRYGECGRWTWLYWNMSEGVGIYLYRHGFTCNQP
jgi:hypothetical protein